jgi:uncharacterized membrane protein
MDTLFKILLTFHILGGTVGLTCGLINIIRKKGDKTHKLVGKGFLYGMLTAGFMSFALSIMHPNAFLFMVGILTIFLVGTGQRYLSLKELGNGQKPLIIDWALTIMMLLGGIAFVAIGINNVIKDNNFGIVFIAFGGLGLRNVYSDFNYYRGIIDVKNYWLIQHIGRMSGGFIASVTAVLVVNSKYFAFIPDILLWLLPTILIVPLIVYWSRKYTVKLKISN